MADQPKSEEKSPAGAKADSINNMLALYLPELQKLAPKHVTPERLLKVMQLCVRRDSKLAQCTPSSLVAALVVASELGLEPGGGLGHLYLVPFADKKTGAVICTPIIGYRGYVALMMRTGLVSSVRAVVVHKKDKFFYAEGMRQTLEHVPSLEEDRGPPTHAYCVIRMTNGDRVATVMAAKEILAIKARSRAKDFGPWVTDELEMWKKTAVKRAGKLTPMSGEQADANEYDGDTIDGEVVRQEELAPAQPGESLKEKVKARRLAITDATAEGMAAAAKAAEPVPVEPGEGE